MFNNVKADVRRVTTGEPNAFYRLTAICVNLGLHAVVLYRLSHWLHMHHLSGVGLVVSYCSSILTGAQISRRANIGKGLAVLHPSGIVIGATTVIGEYCTLVQGNTIGQLRGSNDRPSIGDYFSAGAGAKILGKITIGNHVRVGANSVVLWPLPDGATAVGVPARIVWQRKRAMSRMDVRGGLSHDAIFQRLVPILREFATPSSLLTEASKLVGDGLDLDSIGTLQLACAIEEEFHVKIDDPELSSYYLRTVGSLVTLIEERSASHPRAAHGAKGGAFHGEDLVAPHKALTGKDTPARRTQRAR